MEKKEILLPSKKYFKSRVEDQNIRLGFERNENLLREGDRSFVLDISEQFDKERNECKNYKIYGKLKMVFRNMYSGTTTYSPLNRNLYLIGDGTGSSEGYLPYNEFAFLRNDVLRELNQPNIGSNPNLFSQNIVLTGYTGHTTVTPITAPYHNWNIYLSYVYGQDSEYPMKYTLSGGTSYEFTASDGIPFRVSDNGNYYTFTSPVEHGMSEGEYMVISGGTLTNLVQLTGRTFHIESVGNETYNSSKYVVNILKNQFGTGITLSSVVLCKRCTDFDNIETTTSEYYVHKHKTLTSVDDYIMDKVGFESPIWEDEKKLLFENSDGINDFLVEKNRMESVLFDFKSPLILTGLTNNMGYAPTEVYVSVIFRNGNGFFNYPPKVGYKFHFHDSWIDEHFSGTTTLESTLSGETFTSNSTVDTFTGGTSVPVGTILTGAFVEFNQNEMRERIISESFHKITSRVDVFDHNQDNSTYYSGSSANNMVGLYYQPHYRVKLRQLSPYIETSKVKDVYNLPENVKYFENERLWKWRDLYDHGFIDTDGVGLSFPFMNNIHYVKNDINFYLRNEKQYTNKSDGLIKFNNKTYDC